MISLKTHNAPDQCITFNNEIRIKDIYGIDHNRHFFHVYMSKLVWHQSKRHNGIRNWRRP